MPRRLLHRLINLHISNPEVLSIALVILEIDKDGSVNVCAYRQCRTDRWGGGFVDITTRAKRIVFSVIQCWC